MFRLDFPSIPRFQDFYPGMCMAFLKVLGPLHRIFINTTRPLTWLSYFDLNFDHGHRSQYSEYCCRTPLQIIHIHSTANQAVSFAATNRLDTHTTFQHNYSLCLFCLLQLYGNSPEQLGVWPAGKSYRTLTVSSGNAHITDLPPPMSEVRCSLFLFSNE